MTDQPRRGNETTNVCHTRFHNYNKLKHHNMLSQTCVAMREARALLPRYETINTKKAGSWRYRPHRRTCGHHANTQRLCLEGWRAPPTARVAHSCSDAVTTCV